MRNFNWLKYLALLAMPGCNQLSGDSGKEQVYLAKRSDEVILCAPGSDSLKTAGDHLKKTNDQDGLQIVTNGFTAIPLSGLNGLASFIHSPNNAVVYGDIIINENDLATVHTDLAAQGLNIKDAHRYGARNGSIILFLHVNAFGPHAAALSNRVNHLLTELNTVGRKKPAENMRIERKKNLWINLDSIIGQTGERSGTGYKHVIRRPGVLRLYGIPVDTSLQFNTWASWQGSPENAVVSGDFIMLEKEVAPVIKALAENGFELVDNHPVHEGVNIFSLHYLGFGNAEKLAKGLRAALDQQQMK